jgi:3-oxoacyl-[acyl-carrier-protein] synthase-1
MNLFVKKYCHIQRQSVSVDGKAFPVTAREEKNFLTSLYRSLGIDYPKFFKMDNLSKLGFLASELIFKDDEPRFVPREDMAVICFNRSSSLEADTLFQTSIEEDNYFPSPSVFVYTLPNIVTGEIAIRNKLYGETSFYICEKFDAEQIIRITQNAFQDKGVNFALVAWVEYFEDNYEAFMLLATPSGDEFSVPLEQISRLIE